MRFIVDEPASVDRGHEAAGSLLDAQPTRATAVRDRTARAAGILRTGTV
jgi:hypothetical protein